MLCLLRRVILYGLLISVSHCLLIHAQGPGPGQLRRDVFNNNNQNGRRSVPFNSRTVDMRVQFVVKEGLPPGTFVGRIPTKPGFTYRFNENLEEFHLNGTSGEIRTAKEIDREALPSDQFDLVVLSSQPTYPIDVRITIEDVNDMSPEFPASEIEVRFSEGANAGTLVFLDPAEDKDKGINDVTTEYKILDGNEDNQFRLVVTTNPSGEPPFLHLETTSKLDRETKAFYTLNISAQDGGTPPRFGYLKVNIIIDDSNDNSPNFDHSDYVVSLNESVPPGTAVLQVTATDNDEGDNARITYYLAETETQFTVDSETGVVSTMQILNCQQNCAQNQHNCPKSCVFTVFARDHGVPRQDGRTYITVNLLDSNDHDPNLIIRYFPPTASSASVDENAQNGSVVAAISVVDEDEGPNGDTMVQIVSGNELGHFRLESTPSFQLVRVNGVLDREKISKYNLTIVAIDKGSPPRSSTTFIIIRINDVNDHNPHFLKTEYSAVLRELVPVGSYVASITATDEDTGINSQVYYSIVSGNEAMWFHIDPNSGLLTTRAPLDREQQGTIRLKISARDGGPNPKWAHAQIIITILDDNDERPQLADENLTVSLSEESPPGSLVATLTASDHDQGTNGSVSYYLSQESEYAYPGVFHVDATNGRLTSRLKFDREVLNIYHVQVIAKDQGIPALSSTATVHLSISDVNDNDPQIYPTEYYMTISPDSMINTKIVQIQAFDPDEGLNAKIQFSLDSGGSGGFFTLDESTGNIFLKKDLKASMTKKRFQLSISAKDGGGRKSQEKASVEIVIKSPETEVLKFTKETYTFSVVEDFGTTMVTEGKEVGKVELGSSSAGKSGKEKQKIIKYAIIAGDHKRIFSVDENTGIIRSVKTVDREVKNVYTLTILARSENNAYGSCTTTVTVEDANDHAPKFERKRVVTEISENSPVGCEVYLVKADDPDLGDNARISYSLTQNPDNMFSIDSSNGLISLNKPLRFSPDLTELNIEVAAKDKGNPPLSSRQSILLKVTDYNNHSPIFDHSSYETSLLETTSVNSRFFALQATDQDSGENSQISYEIVDGNGAQKFGVFPDGYLYVKTPLDREEQDYFSLTVMARDNGVPQRSSTVSVVIFLIDENDNSPQLKNSTFTFYIAENEPPDTYVGKVSAIDNDVGRNAELTYSIHSVQSDFMVDPKNGFIKSLRSFDRENLIQTTGQDFISLEIIVQDGGAIRLSDKAQMIIHITDINDHSPVFLRSSYAAQISEAATIGSQVLRVVASDMDEGLNGDIFYYLGEGNDGEVFKIDTTTGQISLAKSLDRETQPQYMLTVIAQDTAENNPLSSSTSVKIDVLDENDNHPVITSSQSESKISIIETTPVNTELIKFHTSDPDIGLNQQVSLSITGGNRHETFRIDSKSGSLYLNKPLDFERYSSYTLNITAADAGNPRLSTSIQFVVVVLDFNDNSPLFPSTAIVRQIQEGIAINTPIVTVSAEDPDSGLNGKVKYSIIDQDPEGNHFGIDPNQGIIHTLKPIDREFADTFRLTVVATDQAIPPSSRLSAEKLVTVIVEDINDNVPLFVSMNAALLTKGTEKNTEIVRVRAKDLDSESNGVVTYEMTSGDASLFKLDRNTGSLALKRSVGDVQPRYQLTIRATDEAIQSQRKSSNLYLSILGVSDKSDSGLVTFSQALYKGSILENEPIGSSILTVSASISDKSLFSGSGSGGSGGNNNNPEIEYYITNITSSKNGDMQDKLFDIDLRRGILSTAAILDREMGVWKFQLEIYAIVVSTRGLHTASTNVLIEITDRTDSPPQFSSKQMMLNISENAPVGQEITTLVATDLDTLGTISYSIVKGDDGKFKLDASTGVLKVMDALDRETKEEYRLVVRANDGIQHSDAIIVIQVSDSNDNIPEFPTTAYSFDIPEDAPPGFKVGTVKAIDPDKGVNGQVTYSVLSNWGNDVFSLNPLTGVFTLTTRLDYEEVQHFIFVIQAQDTGRPSLSSTTTVYCNVLDLNDNSPVFDPMSYNREVYENISIGSSVVTVSATDEDSGLNGKITYSIVSGNDNEVFDVSENGTIFTKTFLDRETKPFYTLTVVASDSGTLKQLSSSVQVSIVLKDENDNFPEFISPNETFVMENSPINTVLLVVKAIDKDEGRNSYVEYILNNEKSTFTLGPVDGLLRVSQSIDRETKQNYTLKITAKDRGEPSKSSSQELLIFVSDVNDNTPQFDPRQYSAAIPENSSIGMSVLQVSATDIDEGVNRQIRYAIIAGDPNRDFVVSEDSGVLRLAKSLNYERKKSYTLTIQAEDAGEQPRYDTATVTIHVSDINDNVPKFLDSPYLAFVRENMVNLPATVLQVKAYDADSAVNNHQVRYLMKDGDKGSFRVNTTTGEITVHRALDRERQSEYILTVVAMDTGTPRLSGTGMVRVRVQDVNDNTPRIEHERYEFIVEENVPLGTVVGQIFATDQDDGLNARIRYQIEDNQRGPFGIKEDTGEIVTRDKIDREAQEIYHLTVKASDSSPVLQRSAYANVTIRISDLNDEPPSFNKSRYTVSISDSLSGGSYVLGVSATDMDSGLNSRIRYYLDGEDADKFQISEKTGVIKSLKSLKNSGATQFNLEIRATDSSPTKPLTSSCHVEVTLVNHQRFPKIKSGNRQFTFPENASNANVTTIQGMSSTTTTSKNGPNDNSSTTIFHYYIGGGNLGEAFRINVNSGLLQISSLGLDFETAQDYELWIEVCDEKEPNLRSAVAVLVAVTDFNDNAPLFEHNVYNLSVPEEEPGPRLIATLLATDIDSGVNGKVEYHLSSESSSLYGSIFGVQPETGEIFTKVKLDREEVAQYTLTIEAVDFGTPSQTGSATLVINVSDANDNPPRFTRLFSVNVTENVPIGTFVIQVTSVDKDVGANANCTYSFTENTYGKFKIDPLSGNVTVSGLLDRESQDEYLLKVAAIDGSWRAETLVTITIQDINDNSPTYEYSYYNFNIPEGDQPVAFVGQVMASDRDKRGPNSLVSYSLKQPSDYFSVDPVSGEIFSKKPLKYKPSSKRFSPENEHSLVVTATDSGKPPMSSECAITINVVDGNNHAPQFERKSYFTPVLEESTIGQRIVQVRAMDPDAFGINAELEYLKISGNGSELFNIEKDSGWITVAENLIGRKLQRFVMQLRVVDKGIPPQSDDVNIALVITGPNKHTPVFSALSYRVIVPENEALNSVIVTVTATDQDTGPNGQIIYNITKGNEQKKFSIDASSGAVSINKDLDYDTKKEYHLNISATDLGYHPKSSDAQLTVILTDINDNAPIFNQTMYTAYLKENSPIGTQVSRLMADDKDSPKNAIIRYSIVGGSGKNSFSMDSVRGIISSSKIFNFEERREYVLEILASNPESNLFGTTQVQVMIAGVNEFYPKFVQAVFQFTVSESAPIGFQVGTVQATDEDIGDDGIVYYLFVGSSNDRGFSINPTTGTISVSRRLDRESQSRVVLTVLAKNGGSIRGNDTDEAQVIILVQDGNDPPIFDKELYHANVSEGAAVGSRVLTVKASDVDVRPSNNRFAYEILGGNLNKTFKIDPISGLILTAATLDRETVPTYELVVGAIDMGQPPQTGTTLVKVVLSDINDNGPTLDMASREGSISENEPPNTKVMTLRAVDPDLSPNGEPFTYTLVGGPDASKFKVDFGSGTVTSLVPFDREITPELKIVVEVQDSGKPPVKSRQEVKILVADKNDSPSHPRNGQLILYTFKDVIPKEKVASVVPMDPDVIGQYTCRLERNEEVFKIPSNCDLYLNKLPTYKRQSLKILADDGRHGEVSSTMLVEFLSFDNQTLDNSIIVRIIGLSPRKFLAKSYTKLLSYFRQIFRYEPHIYSVMDIQNGTDIVVAAGISGSAYERPEDLTNSLMLHKSHIESLLDASIILNYSPCSSAQSVCQNEAACTQSLRAYSSSTRISDSPLLLLSSPVVQMDFFCQCPASFVGDKCQRRKEPCQPNPCFHGVQCVTTETAAGFQCGPCPRGYSGNGQTCEKKPCTKVCRNGGSCQENPQAGTYFCLCRPGFFGNQCQTATDTVCRPNPCLNGGECISNFGTAASAYPRCKCPTHYYGRNCEKSAFGFSLSSYMSFPQLDPNTNDISLIFSTNKRNALLVYNYGEQTGGRSDFVAIELINGVPTLSYGGTRTAIAIITVNKFVSDGGWHRIIATRNSRVISLSVSACKDSGELCADCRPGDPSCYSDDVGPTGTLNFNGNPLLLGGLQSVDPILQRPEQIHTDDFVGCIHGVVVNGRQLNLSAALESRGIANTCQRIHDVCDSSHHKCGPGGNCIDLWDSYTCQCSNNILAPNCDEAFYPYTFSVGSFVEYKIGEKYRRSQLLHSSPYNYQFVDGGEKQKTRKKREIRSKSISFNFRTIHNEAVLLYAASDKDYTMVELENGGLKFSSKIGSSNYPINMSVSNIPLVDGQWHSVKLSMSNQVIHVVVDGERQGEELDAASGHDFLDPYLTTLLLGGLKDENLQSNKIFTGFAGCMSNFTINDELQSLNGSGGLFDDVIHYGKMSRGCSNAIASGAATAPDPLSIGVTLVIVFFVILLVAILVSFVVFRLRRREKSPLPSVTPSTKQSPAQQTTSDIVRNHVLDGEAEAIRNLVRNSKKIGDSTGGYQKPDIIERTTSTPSQQQQQQQQQHNDQSGNSPPSNSLMNSNNGISMDPELSEMPEHYDLENASSIAPSDIDIVYHYKGFRDNLSGGGRKSSPFRHNHHFPGSRQSPGIRQSPISNVLKSTPLARLSPSSELSQQTTPRILTLQDISGKPLQSALLATTQKDAMSQSERSLNISHSSSRSSIVNPSSQGTKKKRKKCAGESDRSNMTIGLTAEEIERLNKNKIVKSLSLVSTLDAVSSSESDDRRKNKLSDLMESNTERMQRPRDTSSDDDESGNDSFTCSEFEYDNEKRDYRPCLIGSSPSSLNRPSHMIFSKLAEVENEEVENEDSFRGSLSTLVASDDELAYVNYSKTTQNPNGGGSSVGWDYLLNWGPNFHNLVGVFKDIEELPDAPNGAMSSVPPPSGINNLGSSSSRRYPTPASEEYV